MFMIALQELLFICRISLLTHSCLFVSQSAAGGAVRTTLSENITFMQSADMKHAYNDDPQTSVILCQHKI